MLSSVIREYGVGRLSAVIRGLYMKFAFISKS